MTHLAKVHKEAARLQKAHPRMSYKEASDKAWDKYRKGTLAGTRKKKKTAKRPAKPAKKNRISGKTHKPAKRAKSSRAVGEVTPTFSQLRSDYKNELKSKLGWALATQRTARTKKEKKGLQESISKMTRELKSLT